MRESGLVTILPFAVAAAACATPVDVLQGRVRFPVDDSTFAPSVFDRRSSDQPDGFTTADLAALRGTALRPSGRIGAGGISQGG